MCLRLVRVQAVSNRALVVNGHHLIPQRLGADTQHVAHGLLDVPKEFFDGICFTLTIFEELDGRCTRGSQIVDPRRNATDAKPPAELVREVVAVAREKMVAATHPLLCHDDEQLPHLLGRHVGITQQQCLLEAVILVQSRSVPRDASAVFTQGHTKGPLLSIHLNASVPSTVALGHRVPRPTCHKRPAKVVQSHEHTFSVDAIRRPRGCDEGVGRASLGLAQTLILRAVLVSPHSSPERLHRQV
mmetsp:Transcript_40675/g.107767  ORF Transcript_40675/g.107767 Transcript_40675/m.107767 type:complete len:244 (+) Transcript_40675:133-864(+)